MPYMWVFYATFSLNWLSYSLQTIAKNLSSERVTNLDTNETMKDVLKEQTFFELPYVSWITS